MHILIRIVIKMDDIRTATEAIVAEASEEASLKRIRNKRYIRVSVDVDIEKKRFRKPMGESKANIDVCYQEETESSERKLVRATNAVDYAKADIDLKQKLINGEVDPKGQLSQQKAKHGLNCGQ